ncbi:MAG: ARPP-1 family domain-containing protein [Chloroflexota bacterium]
MDRIVTRWLEQVEMGEMQRDNGFAVIPLYQRLASVVTYIDLASALEQNALAITEVSEGGRVGDLKVVNHGPSPVLVLDGEELAGAKQNRIVNTTILLKERSESVIPVSCTEQGRWSYMGRSFHHSPAFATPRMRRLNQVAVARSLRNEGGFRADQEQVWAEVSQMAEDSGVNSPTRAMRDIYSARMPELDTLVGNIPVQPRQCGLLALRGEGVLGFDIVSRSDVYQRLHPRLLRSYLMSTSLSAGPAFEGGAEEFLKSAMHAHETRYTSPGHGEDHRYHSDRLVGSALTFTSETIHAAFFGVPPGEALPHTGSLRTATQRRRYRM